MNTNEILDLLLTARDAYYNSGNPIMSDAEFDSLEEELKKIDPNNDYFFSVGPNETDRGKIVHGVPMLSMGKAKTLDNLAKWLRNLGIESSWSLCIQPKVDGLSASLSYYQGKLKCVATRGNGREGQDISHIAAYVKDIPATIPFTLETVEIRGELHLPKNTAFNTQGRPLRNNCTGLVLRKENLEDLIHVRFLAYQILWPDAGHFSSGATAATGKLCQTDPRFKSESDKIDVLEESGFYTFEKWKITAGNIQKSIMDTESDTDELNYTVSVIMKQIEKIYSAYIDNLREAWNFETDGLIVLVDDNRLHDSIDERWEVEHHHHYAMAFKPPAQTSQTTLINIVWQVSRQGNLTPVANFKPVRLTGATLERASLHNADNVAHMKLAVGDTILVERANDVIPYVRENVDARDRPENFRDEKLWPAVCPSCATKPVKIGVNLVCSNNKCRMRILQSILYWVRQAEMDQIAVRTLEALYDAGKLRTIRDLYTLTEDDFAELEGFGDKKAGNFINQAARSRSMTAPEFITRLGIPMVQKKTLGRLGIQTMDDFFKFDDESYVVGKRIIEWKQEPGNLEFVMELLDVLDIQQEYTGIERKGVVCLTGKAPLPRKALTSALEQVGWTIAGAVTRDTVKVVCEDPNAQSTKLKKARESDIEVVSYVEFLSQEGISI